VILQRCTILAVRWVCNRPITDALNRRPSCSLPPRFASLHTARSSLQVPAKFLT